MTTPTPTSGQPPAARRALRWRRPKLVRGKLFANKQRGIALVMVMIAISIVLAISNQFGTSATIDMMAAANYRDQMRAHFLARTALNISELVIRMQGELEKQPMFKGVKLTEYADQFMMAFCGDRNEISEALGVPVDRLKGLGGEIGNCGLTPAISTDDGKINLNCANDTTYFNGVKTRLESLFKFPAYDPIFDDEDAEGWRRNRETQMAALLDYVDKDSIRMQDRGTNEDYGYESLKDAYKSKQSYMDTIGEIKQVRGVDDRFWALFGNAFTVYGGCKVAINAVEDVTSLAAILAQAAENPADKENHQKLYALAAIIIKAREFGKTFSNVDKFIAFAKDPESAFTELGGGSGSGSASSTTSTSSIIAQIMAQAGVPPGVKPGVVLKKDDLPAMEFKGRRTHRVTAWGEINRAQVDEKGNPIFPPVRRTITGVWDVRPTPQNARPSITGNTVGNGAWVFLKEE